MSDPVPMPGELRASDQAMIVASAGVAPFSTTVEQAIAAAEAARQQAKAAAFTAYVWDAVNLEPAPRIT